MNNTRLTFSIVSQPMTAEQARKEFDYSKTHMPRHEDFSSVRGTLEEWDGRQWVIKDKFEHENR